MRLKGKTGLGLGAVAAGTALAALRAMPAAHQNQLQTVDLMNQRRRDLSAPLPDFTAVKRAHAAFAEKIAGDSPYSFGDAVAGGAMQGVGRGVGDAIGDMLVRKPLDVIGQLLKKRLVTQPRQRRIFDHVVGGDPDLSAFHAEHPDQLGDAHATIKTFAPSMATDRAVLRSYLRHAMLTGGTIDPATVKQYADAELAHQRSRGKVSGP